MVLCSLCSVQLTPYQQWVARWLQLALMVVAWMFAIVTVGSCTFVGLPGYTDSKGLGLFSVDINGSCVRYSRTIWYEPDGARSAGQAFGTLTCLALSFGLVAHALVLWTVRDRLARLVWSVTRILLATAFLCAMFTFSFYSSTIVADVCESADDCVLGPAGSVGVMNIWLLLGIFTLSVCIPIPDRPILDLYGPSSSSAIPTEDDKVNNSFATPKRSNVVEKRRGGGGLYLGRGRRQQQQQQLPEEIAATDDDEDLTNRQSKSSEADDDVADPAAAVATDELFHSALFAADRPNRQVAAASWPPIRSDHQAGDSLDEEAVDRAFNPYGNAQQDDPSIVTVSESIVSQFDRQFGTAAGRPAIDPEPAEEPSVGRRPRRRDPC